MNSFVLRVGASHDGGRGGGSSALLPLLPGGTSTHLDARTEIVLAGERGDVSLSVEPGESALLLNGYVAEAEGFDGRPEAQLNCDALHRSIRGAGGMPALLELVASACGSFSLVYLDLSSGRVFTLTDRQASRPVWYTWSDQEFWISSHAVPVARANAVRSYDPGGLASFLLYGTQVAPERSVFAGVRSQDEGTALEHGIETEPKVHRWYSFVHRPEEGRPFGYWLDAAADALTASAGRVLKVTPDPLLFLSGGVDSRIAGAALVASGARPRLLSLADSDNLEIRVARAVAKVLGCPHDVHYRDTGYYLRALERTMQYANGTHSWIHSHFAEAYQQYQTQRSTGGALLGDFCEAFSKMCCRVPPGRTELWSPTEFLLEFDGLPLPNYAPQDRAGSLRLLNEELRTQAEAALQDNILRRYEETSRVSTDPAIVADHFFRLQRGSCHATFQMFHDLRSAGPERNLMFDPELHSLLERLPSQVRAGQRMGAKLVQRLHWPAALVPDANSLVPLMMPGRIHGFARDMRPRLGVLKRRFLSDTYETTASWPHIPLLMQKDAAWRVHLEELLLDDSLLRRESFDRDAIERCWRDFSDGDLRLHADLEKLIGLAWLARMTS